MTPSKPLGRKAYGSIGHLRDSRLGPGDHCVDSGSYQICCQRARQQDQVIVQLKLDGSCVAVAKLDGQLIPLMRAGYPAVASDYLQHRLFHDWAMQHAQRFDALLEDHEWVVGEWLAQVHGTRYLLRDGAEPFVPFDIMREQHGRDAGRAGTPPERATWEEFSSRATKAGFFQLPTLLATHAITPAEAMLLASHFQSHPQCKHLHVDPVEGAVWRVETAGRVNFLAKWVRHDKIAGEYLPCLTGGQPVWNWHPDPARTWHAKQAA